MFLSPWLIPSVSVVGRESAAEDGKTDMGVHNNKKASKGLCSHCMKFIGMGEGE